MKRVRSYEDVRRRRSLVVRFLRDVVILFVIFETLSTFAFKSWTISSSSMSPTLAKGDRIVMLPSAYGIFNPFSGGRGVFKAPARGDIVLLARPSTSEHGWVMRLVGSLVRFVTLQRVSLQPRGTSGDAPLMKRVVAVPGDSVRIDDFVVYVRTAGSTHYLTEYEVSTKAYDIGGSIGIAGWNKDMPLGGSMEPVDLGPGQFFVIGDNRVSTTDSRFFGPVSSRDILGKIAFRYWPLKRAERL